MTPLESNFRSASPRLNPKPTPWHSLLIYAGVFAFWVVLTGMAFLKHGLFAWSVGIAYVGYDTILILFVAEKILSLRWPSPEPARVAGPMPGLAVIIAARNEGAVIGATIDALLAQTDPPDLILIADDGSEDGTADILETHYGLTMSAPGVMSNPGSLEPRLRWLRLPSGGKARALNAALPLVAMPIVVTVDADTILDRDAIEVVRHAFAADPDLAVAGGVLSPRCDSAPMGRVLQFFQTYEYVRNFMSRYAWSRMESLLLISGAFAAFRRDAVIAVGGFDPACLTEDYELMHRVHRHAIDNGLMWRVRILGQAHAVTGSPARVLPFLRQRRRWFAGFLQSQYWNRDMTGTARYGALGLVMLPIKALDTLQPVYGLTAALLLPTFFVTDRTPVLGTAFAITAGKIAIDLAFYLLSVELYRRWTGNRGRVNWRSAILAAIAEPFGFQLLRHLGAAWGWVAVLTGDRAWGQAARVRPVTPPDPA
jgi:cellulose synthase/poly-beta-1,6-N-acetylglucosamine synthase-like glycosyltransferase